MRIGIFSKVGANGGSEHRVAEMANSIHRYTEHDSCILCEDEFSSEVECRVDPDIPIYKHVCKGNGSDPRKIYNANILFVINSDSYSFSKADYWKGLTDHHSYTIDLKQFEQVVFLYNFVISPAQKLEELRKNTNDIKIICANTVFEKDIRKKDKFEKIRDIPRLVLESPIDPNTISQEKHNSGKIRIGKHSKGHGYKFNEESKFYIEEVNKTHGKKIEWDFLGVPKDRAKELEDIENVTIRPEYSIPVKDYLKGIDIFSFFIAWKRSEPWSRAVAEGMMSGCPVLATNKAGNKEQVQHSQNGFLCRDVHDFITYTRLLIDNEELRRMFGFYAYQDAMQYTSEKIIDKFIKFLGI
jgi:hypothetical protein